MKLIKICVLVCISIMVLAGCQAVYATFPPSTKLHFRVAADINPDFDNRPSPVIIRVYELASKTVFENQDFFALYDNPESILRTDLLKKDELVFEPGQRNEYKMSLQPATKAVAVVAAYRDIEGARWRAVVDVKPTGYDDFYVYVDKLAVYIREHDVERKQ
ncbi:type VI secretion system lipoprotein TssJ [Rheinheimera muenzenbergensis]|uniref:Type VI secretion system lipoprotein TssJ n=1 Tax=Rheinheimera muenzenbergensis TaxID=1193628 RepID=A0ABU8C751_9GAMM|nr:type VI secretion system lipoprotein TssJ [Gammaproteobacteria bacterium]MBU1557003.1 type VI secretion system lipoprotein TssJ [Gammaproteobacteria bacterium]MBU2069542.1 type VI secretion system lipoprotein TssJ [Gammaproteobacteria bacterium]MBU2183088.1 type VI secretion system lipoprotein TssJ [Gammaproteobacteria bacterium]MBU2206108.1 type VI secretion system lipoprotein TssJ [Gammaproteobacteria bacterium]